MEHLLNCHGEWVAILAVLGNIPLFGVFAKHYYHRLFGHTHDPEAVELLLAIEEANNN